mmetsp:Transcript_55482/g.161164  ORF Transcript_55482/g.161164 Transcript_55482/m.161164 type:complete len:281 (+) Transcript_55482:35-877(+)|eukprot:CAMPEP_0170213208 /NCGR_PEP_ID=MMETSP0116_2-20130129/6227_1 /TAXON_ID=400756 /ORGANISM="Durinskia baltica, Strain CSIRO CS-38" /LENGTH=280 /DNA_ID=CAMNT_0010463757 /DNA_START=1 /DNA_END=843 /DNA_ORIENTATION=-
MSTGIKVLCRIVAVLLAVPLAAFAFVGPYPQYPHGVGRALAPPSVVGVPPSWKCTLVQSQCRLGWSLFAVNVIIAGAPASGKGTQCEVIKEKFGVVHLSTGDMLRAAVSAGTEIGKLAKDFMDSGKLVPDDVIIGVVKDRLDASDCRDNGWLLDGFPRTQAQANALAEAGVSADCFLFLDVPDEVLVERVVGRRTDPVTGKIYHMKFSPPDDEEVLKRLMQRSDDTEEKVKVRLEQFHANVDSVKDSYSDIMVVIDGNRAPDVVSKDIIEAIESRTKEAV